MKKKNLVEIDSLYKMMIDDSFLMFFFMCSGLEVYPSLEQKKLKITSSTCLHPPVMGSSKCSQLFWREMRSVLTTC